tara:strand:+ start:592 stop:1023 length:432 start_codon:yes stop_codon:yes gene_type:complete
MSTAFLDISAALSLKLSVYATANNIAVSYENSQYTPVVGTKYLRETLMPADTSQAELGTTGMDHNEGNYQVDAFTPASSKLGKSEAILLADGIATQFKRGAVLTYNGVNVRIKSVSRGTGVIDGAWFMIPVFISFKSYTQPRV